MYPNNPRTRVPRNTFGKALETRRRLVVIEDLESVVQDRLNDTDLPARVGDVASRVAAHEGWSLGKLANHEKWTARCVGRDIPEANG